MGVRCSEMKGGHMGARRECRTPRHMYKIPAIIDKTVGTRS